MMSYPNQKIIKKGYISPKDADHPYFRTNVEAYQKACNDLSAEALKLWLYFQKNEDNYEFELSPKACEAWGLKKDSYYKAMAALIEKGYLKNEFGNKWLFNEEVLKETEKISISKSADGTWQF